MSALSLANSQKGTARGLRNRSNLEMGGSNDNNATTQMGKVSRACCYAFAMALAAATPATAAETWNRTSKIMSGEAKNLEGVVKIQIVGDTLNWQPDP